MQNNYVILTAMYHYAPSFFEGSPSKEKLRDKLLSFNPHKIPGAKLMVKKALDSNYGITNREQLDQTIHELMLCNWWDGPIYAILIDLFLAQPEAFSQLTPRHVEEFLSDFSRLDTYIARFAPVNEIWESPEQKEEYLKELLSSIPLYFSPESAEVLQELETLFRHNQSWLSNTAGVSWAAFNYSRIISIIADAAVCGYVSEEEASEMCNHYGSMAVHLFRDWQTFLFSAILGKQLLTPKEDRFILGANDYIEGCYQLAASPLRPLEISGIWPNSDLSLLVATYAGEFSADPRQNTKTSRAIDKYEQLFLPLFRKYGVDYFLQEKKGDAVFYYAPNDAEMSSGITYYEMTLERFANELDADETPLLVCDKCLLTDKYIRIHIKKLFRKAQKLVIPWNGPIELQWEVNGLQNIHLRVNGLKTFEIRPNLDRIGMTATQALGLSKKETQEAYGPDLENLNRAIQELKQVLSQ